MELLVRGEDPESEDGKLLIRVEAESSAVRIYVNDCCP